MAGDAARHAGGALQGGEQQAGPCRRARDRSVLPAWLCHICMPRMQRDVADKGLYMEIIAEGTVLPLLSARTHASAASLHWLW